MSTSYLKLRQEIYKRDGRVCQKCGMPATLIHHKSYKISSSITKANLKDLILLCKRCHVREHYRLEVEKREKFWKEVENCKEHKFDLSSKRETYICKHCCAGKIISYIKDKKQFKKIYEHIEPRGLPR